MAKRLKRRMIEVYRAEVGYAIDGSLIDEIVGSLLPYKGEALRSGATEIKLVLDSARWGEGEELFLIGRRLQTMAEAREEEARNVAQMEEDRRALQAQIERLKRQLGED